MLIRHSFVCLVRYSTVVIIFLFSFVFFLFFCVDVIVKLFLYFILEGVCEELERKVREGGCRVMRVLHYSSASDGP